LLDRDIQRARLDGLGIKAQADEFGGDGTACGSRTDL
jgi:hypothetical protein